MIDLNSALLIPSSLPVIRKVLSESLPFIFLENFWILRFFFKLCTILRLVLFDSNNLHPSNPEFADIPKIDILFKNVEDLYAELTKIYTTMSSAEPAA